MAWLVLASAAAAQILINELEYDQSGTDTADFVELYEPALSGLSLDGWQLVLYNGQASQCIPYHTIELNDAPGGAMPADGYLVIGSEATVAQVDVPVSAGGWLQNGAPDGMALVHDGAVVELLAYEGSFEGAGGPAAGMVFPDVGLEDYGSYHVGLHRFPDGGSWMTVSDDAATPGEPNSNEPGVAAYGGVRLMHQGDADSGPVWLCVSDGQPPYTLIVTTLPDWGVLSDAGGPVASAPAVVIEPLVYAPQAGFCGVDAFEYYVEDDLGSASDAAIYEFAVQQQCSSVVISEVMHSPMGEPLVYEYVEIHNSTAQVVSLGRLDAARPLSPHTVGNLSGCVIASGATKLIVPGPAVGEPESFAFRCEWGLLEADVFLVPSDQWEAIFSVPAATCSESWGSRVLLFDLDGMLLDAVDLSDQALEPSVRGESLTIEAAELSPPGGPLDSRNNDSPAVWVLAGQASDPGVRGTVRGDAGSPMYVPTLSVEMYATIECRGRCCLGGGACQVLTQDQCIDVGGDWEQWVPETLCDVDLQDFAALVGCLAGPEAAPPAGCSEQDLNSDGVVDLDDVGIFQGAFTAPACP